MQAIKAADIPVPEFHLSNDDALFIMKRFDLSDDGQHPGFEDMCVLQGKQRDDKYTGSYEQIAKTIKLFASPAYKQTSLVQFYQMLVLNTHLQNGDAHLKNFGLLYDGPDSVRLAPAYDVVSTTCYIKQDIAALTLLGSKKWWTRRYLIEFGINACDLTRRQAEQRYDQCINALNQTAQQVKQRLASETDKAKTEVLTHLIMRMETAE
jgi:serine/threonine-protein kinase HipA